MPGFDGTGPFGKGTRSGRGFGNCTPNEDVFASQLKNDISDIEKRIEGLEVQIEKIIKHLEIKE